MSVSSVPAVLDELVVRVRLAVEGMTLPEKPPVQVLDGGPHKDTAPEVIAIGFTGIAGEAAVEYTRTIEQGTIDPAREQYDVTCLASSWLGEQVDPKLVRDRLYALLDAVADEIARDQTLGRLLMRARVSSQLFAAEQTNKGAVATVRFIVHCDGYTR